MTEPTIPSPELIAELRDFALELYQRRLPEAAPEPGTSLYAILEGAAAIWAVMIVNGSEPDQVLASLTALVEADRADVIAVEANPDPDFYKPLTPPGELSWDREIKTGTAPNTKCILEDEAATIEDSDTKGEHE